MLGNIVRRLFMIYRCWWYCRENENFFTPDLLWDWGILPSQITSSELLWEFIIALFVALIVIYFMYWAKQRPHNSEWKRIQGKWERSEWERSERGRVMLTDALNLSPPDFERRIQYLLQDLGWEDVERVGGSGDNGVDVRGFYCGEFCIVQCKRYSGSVASKDIRELEGARSHAQADRAFLITTGRFTKQGHEFARGKPIDLWDRDLLTAKFQRQSKLLEDPEPYKQKRRLYDQQRKQYAQQRRRSLWFYGTLAVVVVVIWTGFITWILPSPVVSYQGLSEQAPPSTEIPTPQPQQATITHTLTIADTCGQSTIRGVERLTLRSAPGLNTNRIGDYPSGTQVMILCETPVQADSVLWQRVRVENIEGWMSKGFLEE